MPDAHTSPTPSPNASPMTVGELRARLEEIHAPDDAEIRLEDASGTYPLTISFVHPPAWPGGGGTPTVDIELEIA